MFFKKDVWKKGSINEIQGNGVNDMGETFAHMLGHALSMRHDFIRRSSKTNFTARYDSSGNTCTNINAVMDWYRRPVNKWSGCSKDYLEDFADGVGACLKEATCPNAVTTTTSTTTTATTTTTTTLNAETCLKVKTFFNTKWRDWFGNETAGRQAIKDIVAEANRIFGFPGLSTAITIQLVEGIAF